MANSHSSDTSPKRFGRGTPASELLQNVSFPLAVRGYDRRAVDEFLEELRNLVADLEAHQTREGVVQKALDELGEETAGILQRAHETADEIAARSRAQADGRLQRAEREAEIVKREADEYVEQVVADTRLLWDERQRLIEDVRHLADEVLATADDAIERLKLPEPLAAAEQEEEPTSASNVTPIPHPLSIARDPEHDRRSDPSVPYDLETPEDETEAEGTAAWGAEDDQDDSDATALWRGTAEDQEEPGTPARWRGAPAGEAEDPEITARWRGAPAGEAEDPETTARWRGSPDDDEDDTETTARWSGSPDDDEDDTETTARWRGSASDEDEDPETTARWRGSAAADEDEPDTAEGWGVAPDDEDEQDPDATVAWSAVDSEDPEATAPYSAEDEYDDEPGAGAPPPGDPDSDEDAGHQTVELEALPGGNADDQAAEPERKRD
jgi:DivIVA domain-containing protein